MRTRPRALFLCAALCAATPVSADILDLQVKREDRRFLVRFEVEIEVPPAEVLRLFDEPTRWTSLSRVIRRAGFVEAPAAGTQPAKAGIVERPISMVVRDCILFFCPQADKVTLYRIEADGRRVTGTGVVGAGDFRYGKERWEILPSAQGTRLRLDAELEPDFRVPPFIGPRALKSMLRKLLGEMEHNLEQAPKQSAPKRPEWEEPE